MSEVTVRVTDGRLLNFDSEPYQRLFDDKGEYRITRSQLSLDLHACINNPRTIYPGRTATFSTGIAIEYVDQNAGESEHDDDSLYYQLQAFVYQPATTKARKGLRLNGAPVPIDADDTSIELTLQNDSKHNIEIVSGEIIGKMYFLPVDRPLLTPYR